jgi:hypothetical protein
MVNTQVERMLKEMAQKEAANIVANVTQKATVRVTRMGPGPSRQQYAPKTSWLGLGKGPYRRTISGQLAEGFAVAEAALSTGPAERGVLTKLLTDTYPWSRNTASSCISRLVAMGRLEVVKQPGKSS